MFVKGFVYICDVYECQFVWECEFVSLVCGVCLKAVVIHIVDIEFWLKLHMNVILELAKPS